MADALGLHREMVETVNTKDYDRLRELYGDNYSYWCNDGTTGDADVGVEVARTYNDAFSDLTLEIAHETSCGDTSVVEFVARGTHTGELAGIAPTGKQVEVRVCNIIEVQDGKIRAEREYFDQLGLMQQLGVIPTD